MNATLTIERNKKLLAHAGCWLLFIVYEQTAVYYAMGNFSLLSRSLFYYACNIGLFYLHWQVLNYSNRRGRIAIWRSVLLTLGELAAILPVKYLGNIMFNEHAVPGKQPYWRLTLLDLHRSLFFIGLATLIWSVRRIASYRQLAAEADRDRLQAERDRAQLQVRLADVEVAYYQHQLNPHLLFNTLNFIYNGVAGHSESAARSVLLLAEIQRFCLRGSGPAGKIVLDEELQQIANLVEINRLRFGGQLAVRFITEGQTAGAHIIPLILLTLTENVFKHGLVNDITRPAELLLRVDPTGSLFFRVQNHRKREEPQGAPGGLGIRNVRLRLDNAYGDSYRLAISETPDAYALTLHIEL